MLVSVFVLGQSVYSRQDSLRGSVTPERAWWDLNYYHLNITVDSENKRIDGSNTIRYKVITSHDVLQVDLQPPLRILSVMQDGKELEIVQEGNAHFIKLVEEQVVGEFNEVIVAYGGMPREAMRPPWDGGITWKKDGNGLPFIASSCQGIGASIWWPNKDHMADEVDSMLISVRIPENLMDVSNGRLRKVDENGDGTKTWHWFVSNPINNYGVNINIGDYIHWSENYSGEKGDLSVDYYALRENEAKAREHFKEVPIMLKAFEHWFGPYPFYEDGYTLVEAPYLGMEHQSSITYGNKFMKGYLGRDLSGTGWGLKFDFIIIHESGHEWFANNITYKDMADMWIHESFTNYSESLYLEQVYGKKAGNEYVRGTRKGIRNNKPIIADYGVNVSGSGDMYPKGGNMLHTIRQVLDDDKKWREILRGLNKEFYHQTVTTAQIENYISTKAGRDFSKVFDQYLRDYRIPILEYQFSEGNLEYRWNSAVNGFDMPVEVIIGSKAVKLEPTNNWKKMKSKPPKNGLRINPDYYVGSLNVSGK